MKNNVTEIFLATAPSRYRIPFGVSTNVMLKAVSNEAKRDKNGVKINKNCFMTFAAIDVENENKVLSERVFDTFNIDKPDFARLNFSHQLLQLSEILKAVVPADNFKAVSKSFNDMLIEHMDVFKEIGKLKKEDKPKSKLLKSMKEVQQIMVNSFIEVITPYLGDKGDLLQIVVVTGRTGKFFEFPREDKGFIAKASAKEPLTVDHKYARWYADRNKKEVVDADDIGEDEEVMEESDMILDDDQGLDDI